LIDVGEAEKALGRGLKKAGVDRSDIVVSTKIFRINKNVNTVNNLNRKHIVESVDASLSRLQLDYVDVIFAHAFDDSTPI
jgi:aryl-alcohol dehydrogenase-like predicted oxidoreductase